MQSIEELILEKKQIYKEMNRLNERINNINNNIKKIKSEKSTIETQNNELQDLYNFMIYYGEPVIWPYKNYLPELLIKNKVKQYFYPLQFIDANINIESGKIFDVDQYIYAKIPTNEEENYLYYYILNFIKKNNCLKIIKENNIYKSLNNLIIINYDENMILINIVMNIYYYDTDDVVNNNIVMNDNTNNV